MKLGDFNDLIIGRLSKIGLFLRDDEGNEVLLPNRYVPETYEIGQAIRVFVYNDSEGRPIATTLEPLARVNQFAWLECKDTNAVGAFLDIGIMKDLLVPKKNQSVPMKVGECYLVWVYEDKTTKRLAATVNLESVLSKQPHDLDPNDEVDFIVWQRTEIGWRVVVNNEYQGMVYHNQLFRELHPGQQLKGYVNQLREDGKIDVLLQKPGFAHVDDASATLLEALRANNGFLPLTDSSTPEEISRTLGMSKKTFKKALGGLYKQRMADILENGVRLK